MSRLQFVSLVRQTTLEGERDFFFNGKEWQQLNEEPSPTAPEPGIAPEEEVSPDLPLEP